MHKVAILAIALSLGGCGLIQQAEIRQHATALSARAEEAVRECREAPLVSYVERAQCLNDAALIARPISTNLDLLDRTLAARLEIAARVDRQEITPEQGETEYAQFTSQSGSIGGAGGRAYSGGGCVSENSYGATSCVNGLPRTHLVSGYYRSNGTYVAPYWRSK